MRNHLKSLGGSLATLLLLATSANLSALTCSTEAELSFTGGWRQDHLRSFSTSTVSDATDLVRGSTLNIWQVGVQGWMSPFMSECEPLLNNFFVRGSGSWGWVNDGIYLHRVNAAAGTVITIDRGDISHGHTWDYTVGGGYLFSLCDGIKIGPTGGYSWNKLTFKGENVIGVIDTLDGVLSTAIDPNAYFDEGVLVSSKWYGPWAGLDAFWERNGWNLYASYEYHWARWKGGYRSAFPDLADDSHFSDKRSGKGGFGHTGYLGAHYTFCGSWIAGLGVKYQYFRVARGHLTPTAAGGFPAVGGTADEINHVKTTWNTVSVSLDLGYSF